MERVEHDLKQFIEHYEKIKMNFDSSLDSIERTIAHIEQLKQEQVCEILNV